MINQLLICYLGTFTFRIETGLTTPRGFFSKEQVYYILEIEDPDFSFTFSIIGVGSAQLNKISKVLSGE